MFDNIKKYFELQLQEYFDKQKILNSTLKSAMSYSLLNNNSKRIRAILVYLISECFELSSKNIFHISFAVESIHTYSLIHDDLPSMDNPFHIPGDACRLSSYTLHVTLHLSLSSPQTYYNFECSSHASWGEQINYQLHFDHMIYFHENFYLS